MLLQSVPCAVSARLSGHCMSHAVLNCKPCSCSVQCTNEQVGGGLLLRKTGAFGRLKKSLEKQFMSWKGGISPAVGTGQTPRKKCRKRQEKESMDS